jgi:hypothetical protein
MEQDDMASEKAEPRRAKKDHKPPQDSRGDEGRSFPAFLNDGPEMVRGSHC